MLDSGFTAITTRAGINAATSAKANGLKAELGWIGVSATAFTPTRQTTAIPNEIKRVRIGGSADMAYNQVHLSALFDGGTYTVRTVGFYLEDGTLFAVWSHSQNVLFYKTALNKVAHGFDLVLDSIPPDSITVNSTGDVNLFFAPELVSSAIAQTRMATNMIRMLRQQQRIDDQLLAIGD
ncbi:Uncharacterised protein [BD1-7 clade bacterium]|uniref:Phage tail fibre protein N-terminal domain-containing protein n=1 Tax=BD1-7 clade bacterium TaxID=2029982 RepID=A0A5S9Q381_9GAMM|nr:Uncharacterised protein [BD1-7 clade bacterium]CAA0111794.1 Uncharacterised protein [BD1-7 clade bacterium]